jgi:hypothetical protein
VIFTRAKWCKAEKSCYAEALKQKPIAKQDRTRIQLVRQVQAVR